MLLLFLVNCKDNLYFAEIQMFYIKTAISILHFLNVFGNTV